MAAAALFGAVCLLVPAAAAQASTAAPATPSGVHVAATSATSFTVVAKPAKNAKTYRLYASTVKSDVYAASLSVKHATRKAVASAKPSVTLSRLPYSTAVWWYRLVTVNGARVRYSPILSTTLKPATPTALTTHAADGYLTWKTGPASGFTIVQASNAAMTAGRRTYTIRWQNAQANTTATRTVQFTPAGLTRGTTWYFQVRANNAASSSAFGAKAILVGTGSEQSVRVLTYNILEASSDGSREGSGTVAPWASQRGPAAAALITSAAPDVISIQEGASYVPANSKTRQVDSLTSLLGPSYTLASTEVPPTQKRYFRTSQYIIYNNTRYEPSGAGGHFSLDAGCNDTLPATGQSGCHYFAYQALKNKASGATFLFVATHLAVGTGTSYSTVREAETRTMLAKINSYDAAHGNLPVVYAGDFNSYLAGGHPFDGPGRAMQSQPVPLADGILVAQQLSNQQYNSSNQYLSTPPAAGVSIDHVFAGPGVSVQSWGELLRLSKGRFVGVLPSDHNPVVVNLTYRY